MLKSKFGFFNSEMVHLRVKVGFVGILSGVALVLSLQKWIGVNLIDYSTQLSVGVTLITIGIGYWAFKPQIERLTSKVRSEEKQEKIENHKQHILELLQNPAYAYFPEYDQFGKGEVSWSSSVMYQYCLSHLESYPDLYESFEKAKKYSEDIIHQISTKIQESRDLIEHTLSSFKDLPESDVWVGYVKPYFMKKRFEDILLKDIASSILYNTNVRPFNLIRPTGSSFFTLNNGQGECAVGDEDTLTKLVTVIKPLESNSKLRSLINEIEELKKRLRDPTTWEEFNNKREKLVLDLTKGQKDLIGHCNYCP